MLIILQGQVPQQQDHRSEGASLQRNQVVSEQGRQEIVSETFGFWARFGI